MDGQWWRCSLCGAISGEDDVLRNEDDDPVACPVCGSGWIDDYFDDEGADCPEEDEA